MYKVSGLQNLERALSELGRKAGFKALTGALRDAARPMVANARSRAGSKTGRLKKGIRTQVFRGKGKSNSVATLHMGFHRKTAFHGQILERGAKAHDIPSKTVGRGRNKRANQAKVAFGGKVFSRVRHPGINPKPMLLPAFETMHPQALKVLKMRLRQRIILEAVKKYGKGA